MTRLLAVSTAGRPMPRLRVLAAAGLGAVALALLAILQVAGDPANNASGNVAPGWEMSWVLALSVVAAPLDGMRAVPLPLLGECSAFKALSLGFALGWALQRARTDPDVAGMLAGLLVFFALLVGLSQPLPVLLERTLTFSLVRFVPPLGAALATMPGPMRAAALAVTDGFDAAVEHSLPGADPVRPRVSITPDLGGRLSKAFARPPTRATPLPPDVDGRALCQVPGQPGGALLLVRDAPPRPQMRPAISRLLTAASGVADGRVVLQDLAVQRWRGVCGQP